MNIKFLILGGDFGFWGVGSADLILKYGREDFSEKRMGGGKRTRERTLTKIFGPLQKSFWSALSWIFVQEKTEPDT